MRAVSTPRRERTRTEQLCQLVSDFIKPIVKENKELDKLEILQYAASQCTNIEEYTLLNIGMDEIVKETIEEVEKETQEEHEKTCDYCRARRMMREAEEILGRRRDSHFRQVAPNVFMFRM